MNVKETFKGKAGKTLVFRQYVWNANGGSHQSISPAKTWFCYCGQPGNMA
jgi:hypothetical protein